MSASLDRQSSDHPDGKKQALSLRDVIDQIVADDPSIEQVLERVVSLAAQIIEGVDGASITLFGSGSHPYTMCSSHDWVREVDRRQYEAKEGPCVEVAATRAPASGSAALGVRSLLAVGISPRPDGHNPASGLPGALNLYSRRPHAFDIAEREQALALAAITGLVLQWTGARLNVERLRDGLTSRDIIGQAKGILMERHGINADEAFVILRRASNDLNIKLRDVAARIAQPDDPMGPDTVPIDVPNP
ncbi:MAG: ANTAR domain-containing protein [Propionibacteriaceae bacterium]|nr:ANTAR domain-containing protein [Propionibacteriaceae bacterium]